MAEENSDKGFTDMLGDLGSYLMQPDVLLPGVVGGLLTGEAYGRLSDIGREARTGAEALAAQQMILLNRD